jgi:serine protease Do
MNQDLDKFGVFQVFTGDGTGSGFLIDKTHLVTNCHVVTPYRSVAVELRDKRRIVGTVRRVHPKRDLALVELATQVGEEILPLDPAGGLKPQQTLHIIGFPVGLPLSVTEGVVSNPKQLVSDQYYVQTDAAINPGNSGGPMLDEHKRVVAVTTCKLTSADMVGFGIPAADVSQFIEGFASQTDAFGVVCPACDSLLASSERYCTSCGMDLEPFDIATYFDPPADHPVVTFVETALARAGVDPVLARHGEQNWSFHSGSAPIRIWCCCSEHLCFSSPLAQVGKQGLGDLFRYLLSPEHEPFAFDLDGNVIRLNLTFHVSDIFARDDHDAEAAFIAKFVEAADAYDNLLIDRHGCEPAPETQITFLKEAAR